ncbi:hypothetical protein BGX28_008882, partial [Mortierella sp. GBA30]
MSLKQGSVFKTGLQSKSRILLIGLIFSAVFFVFAVQVEWVPYLNYSSSTNGESTVLLEGTSHISMQQPPKIPAPSTPPAVRTKPSPQVHNDDGTGNLSGDKNGVMNHQEQDSSNSNIEDDDDALNEHEYVKPSPSPSTSSRTASTLASAPTTSTSSPILPEEEEPLQLDGNKEHNPFLSMFPPRPPDEGERFLGFLPHSGFHNQLLSLENALRLAAYLNRTLLLPPLHLSRKKQALVWKEPPVLFQQWAERSRAGVEYCREVDTSNWPRVTRKQLDAMPEQERKRDRECRFYHSWTTTPWTYFYDIPKVLKGVVGIGGQKEPLRVFDRPVMSLEWLQEHLGIQDISKDVFFYNDTNRYEYRIVDDSETDYGVKPGSEKDREQQQASQGIDFWRLYSTVAVDLSTPGETIVPWDRRYTRDLLLTDLQKRPERILHFGSLFASDRIEARSENHKALRDYISHAMDLWNQGILDATALADVQIQKWIKETGRAAPGFLGTHLRTEDGGFKKLAPKNLQRIIAWLGEMKKRDRKYLNEETKALSNTATITTTTNKRAAEPGPPPLSTPIPSNTAPNDTKKNAATTGVPQFLERCKEASPDSPMVFMATDVHQPRESGLLQEYLDQYPCTMFLSDFVDSLSVLEKIQNPVDGILMMPYMLALMDANLAARGREFQGTEQSTFSAYI